jgi:hypothetical protein
VIGCSGTQSASLSFQQPRPIYTFTPVRSLRRDISDKSILGKLLWPTSSEKAANDMSLRRQDGEFLETVCYYMEFILSLSFHLQLRLIHSFSIQQILPRLAEEKAEKHMFQSRVFAYCYRRCGCVCG